jgi:hypothetical protein
MSDRSWSNTAVKSGGTVFSNPEMSLKVVQRFSDERAPQATIHEHERLV